MRTWLLNQFDKLRNSLWFVPAIGLFAALITAIVLLQVDAAIEVEVSALQWASTTGPAARATLSTLAGALVTVTGVVFSVTMLTLAQTSAMFGSRLLRAFLNHNITQFTLAMFLGTSVYCFSILWMIRAVDGEEMSVPLLSVSVGLLAGLGSLATFIYFIHHVSRSIQAQTVVRNVALELEDAIDRLFPEQLGDAGALEQGDPEAHDPLDEQHGITIESRSTGYLQAVDEQTLLEFAVEKDLVIRLVRRPGDFLAVGTPIAIASAQPVDDLAERIRECFLTGSRRTPRQDIECTVRELVEVAVRALSPGINDPHTAESCIDYLGAALTQLVQRKMPSAFRHDHEHRLRVIAKPTSFRDVLDAAFDEIRRHGRGNVSVTARLVETLVAIAQKTSRPADRDALLRQAAMLERGCEAELEEKYDRADVRERLRELYVLLGSDPPQEH